MLRDEFFEAIVLHGPAQGGARDPAHVGQGDVEREQDDGGAIDGHRGGDLVERYAVEQDLHVAERIDRHAAHTHLAERPRRIGVVPIKVGKSKAVERPVCPWDSRNLKRSLVWRGVPKPANMRIVQGRPRYIVGCTPRVNGNCPGKPRSDESSEPDIGRGHQIRDLETAPSRKRRHPGGDSLGRVSQRTAAPRFELAAQPRGSVGVERGGLPFSPPGGIVNRFGRNPTFRGAGGGCGVLLERGGAPLGWSR